MTTTRRGFLAGSMATLAAPLAAGAQQARRMPRVAILCVGWCGVTLPGNAEGGTFREALALHGYDDGRNIIVDERAAGVEYGALRPRALDLVRRRTDVILAAHSVEAVKAAREATSTVAIVMVAVPDAEQSGLVQSLSRPGANITGLSLPYTSLVAKHVQLVREIAPTGSRIGLLQNPENPDHTRMLAAAHAAIAMLKIAHESFGIVSVRDIRPVFDVIATRKPNALLILDDPLLYRGEVMSEALKLGVPVIGLDGQVPKAGGLMSYGPNRAAMYGQSVAFIDRILRGTPPGQLPVEEPRKFDLIVNGTTAKALGLTIPPSLLLRADQVIE